MFIFAYGLVTSSHFTSFPLAAVFTLAIQVRFGHPVFPFPIFLASKPLFNKFPILHLIYVFQPSYLLLFCSLFSFRFFFFAFFQFYLLTVKFTILSFSYHSGFTWINEYGFHNYFNNFRFYVIWYLFLLRKLFLIQL